MCRLTTIDQGAEIYLATVIVASRLQHHYRSGRDLLVLLIIILHSLLQQTTLPMGIDSSSKYTCKWRPFTRYPSLNAHIHQSVVSISHPLQSNPLRRSSSSVHATVAACTTHPFPRNMHARHLAIALWRAPPAAIAL